MATTKDDGHESSVQALVATGGLAGSNLGCQCQCAGPTGLGVEVDYADNRDESPIAPEPAELQALGASARRCQS